MVNEVNTMHTTLYTEDVHREALVAPTQLLSENLLQG
jgi:hypothetical protein